MLIGLDVGTSGLKAIAVDPDTGATCATSTHEYPLYTPRPGWAEQEGGDFVRAAKAALGSVAAELDHRAGSVTGIGLSGQMHSSMLLDGDGKLVRPAILWCDTRTTVACETITRKVGKAHLARTVGNAALEGFTLPKLLWVAEHEPDVFERVRTVVLPKDYVAFELTGRLGTELSDASATLAFEPGTRQWSASVLSAVGVSPDLFPDRVGDSASPAGELLPSIAAEVGLPPGVPVACGAADNAAGALGLGVVHPGSGMVTLGTSGAILAPTEEFTVDPTLRLHSFCHAVPDTYYLMGAMLAAGGALRWYRDVLGQPEVQEASAEGTDAYRVITDAAGASPIGAGGVIFLPYILGERTPYPDANARACFIGMTARTTKRDLSRAVLEGVTYGLADSLDLIRSLDGSPKLDELRATGGGAKSAFWRQMLADVLGIDVVTTSSTEGPAFGAALLAGVASGRFSSLVEACAALVRVTGRATPDAERRSRYESSRAVYRKLYGDLKERFRELGEVDR